MLVAAWVRERYTGRAIRQRGLKHPFTRGLRRPPGYSLSVQIPELQMEAVSRMFFAIVIGTTITVVAPIALGIFAVPSWVGILVGIAGAFGRKAVVVRSCIVRFGRRGNLDARAN